MERREGLRAVLEVVVVDPLEFVDLLAKRLDELRAVDEVEVSPAESLRGSIASSGMRDVVSEASAVRAAGAYAMIRLITLHRQSRLAGGLSEVQREE